MIFYWLLILICLVLVGAGCENGAQVASAREKTAPEKSPDGSPLPTRAQPKLPAIKLYMGAAELTAEVARTPLQVQAGMMFRTELAENDGMLFVFQYPHRTAFWMKNTQVPLSAAYISPEGVILEIHRLEPYNTNSVPAASDRVQFVLEANQGWFQTNNVGTGTVVRTDRGTLEETFFRRR